MGIYKLPVFRVVGTAQTVTVGGGGAEIHSLALFLGIFPLGFAVRFVHPPVGVGIVLPGIEDQAIVADYGHTLFPAQIHRSFDEILPPDQRLVHLPGCRGIVTQTHVGLQIDHGILHLGGDQVLHIFFRTELT